MRIKNANTFTEFATDGIYCTNLIRVSCEKKEAVGLAIDCSDIMRIRLNRGRKVLDTDNLLVRPKEPFDERSKIKPFVLRPLEKSVPLRSP